jgi:hypothetical protein
MRWWNGSFKSLLKKKIEKICLNNKNFFLVFGCGSKFKLTFQEEVGSMELCCINVFSTMKLNGVKLDINPINKVIFVNLLCSKKEINFNKKRMNLDKFMNSGGLG